MAASRFAYLVLAVAIVGEASAEERCPLVVASDSRVAEISNCIGRDIVVVETLYAASAGEAAHEYNACNARAAKLRNFDLYLYRTDSPCPRESFWRERLTTANPRGQVHKILPGQRVRTSEYEMRVTQLTRVHAALLAAIPEHKASFDANLLAELKRLQMLRLHASHLAFSEPTRP